MKLIDNWRTVLRKAWSMRFMALATLLSGLEVTLPMLDADLLPTGVLAAAGGVVTALALLVRLVAQKEISDAGK